VLVAVIIPDAEIAKQWAAENGIPEEGQMAALCGSAKFKAAIMGQMKSAGDAAKLKGFEVVRDIHLESELFSVDNDLLTPTFKLKRPQVPFK
jgi:long-chain acyl-CoA synthetase